MTEPGKKERLKNILVEKNPFASSSAGDPWDSIYPNVESVNQKAFEGICQLIRQKAANPSESFAGLVLGEVGTGKTHLIGRILEQRQQPEFPFLFAYIQPIEDPDQTYRYLLRELIVNLCHPADTSSNTTFLDRIISETLKEDLEKKFKFSEIEKHNIFLSRLRTDPAYIFQKNKITPEALEYVEKRISKLIIGQCPEFPPDFLKVLFQCRVPEKRPAALNWLKACIIDDEHALLLGVQDRKNKSEASLEQEARDIIYSFSMLMARYSLPMVICFDRLENLETEAHIHSLGKMVEFLVDTAKSMLPVVCFRELRWYDNFRNKLNQHVVTRLETNKYELEGCTPDQALDIVRSRLAVVLAENQEDDLFPFDKDKLTSAFKEGGIQTPRNFITQANQHLKIILGKQAEPVPLLRQLQDEFETQYQKILADFDRHVPDRGRLRHALELYLSHASSETGCEIESVRQFAGKDKYVDFMCKIRISGSKHTDAIFIIDVEDNHSSVGASLKRGLDFYEKFPSGKALYIRDARCPFPTSSNWPATNEIRRKFEQRGGKLIFLNDKDASGWYALALLSYAVKEGDVTNTDSDAHKGSLSPEDFALFILEMIHGKKYPFFYDLDKALSESSNKDTDTDTHTDTHTEEDA